MVMVGIMIVDTEHCQDARSGKSSHGGPPGTHCIDCNDNCGNIPFTNSSLVKN